jgi:hypothetical protein
VGLLGELLCLGHAERVARAPGGPTVGPTHNPVDWAPGVLGTLRYVTFRPQVIIIG